MLIERTLSATQERFLNGEIEQFYVLGHEMSKCFTFLLKVECRNIDTAFTGR